MSELREEIFKMIENLGGGVTFAQLQRLKNFNGDREYVLKGPDFSNIVLWNGLSSDAISAIQEMRVNQEIIICPTSILTYMSDGAYLSYPIVKKRKHYKNPRWSPCVMWTSTQAKKNGFFEKWKCREMSK